MQIASARLQSCATLRHHMHGQLFKPRFERVASAFHVVMGFIVASGASIDENPEHIAIWAEISDRIKDPVRRLSAQYKIYDQLKAVFAGHDLLSPYVVNDPAVLTLPSQGDALVFPLA